MVDRYVVHSRIAKIREYVALLRKIARSNSTLRDSASTLRDPASTPARSRCYYFFNSLYTTPTLSFD